MINKIMKYNPAFLNEDDLVESFAARQDELKIILNTIRGNDTQSNQHMLIIGSRGTGKTTH